MRTPNKPPKKPSRPESSKPESSKATHFKAAEKAGHLAETRAVLWYRLRGFHIVARRGQLLVFLRSQIPAKRHSSGQPLAVPAKTDHARGVIIHLDIGALPEL